MLVNQRFEPNKHPLPSSVSGDPVPNLIVMYETFNIDVSKMSQSSVISGIFQGSTCDIHHFYTDRRTRKKKAIIIIITTLQHLHIISVILDQHALKLILLWSSTGRQNQSQQMNWASFIVSQLRHITCLAVFFMEGQWSLVFLTPGHKGPAIKSAWSEDNMQGRVIEIISTWNKVCTVYLSQRSRKKPVTWCKVDLLVDRAKEMRLSLPGPFASEKTSLRWFLI